MRPGRLSQERELSKKVLFRNVTPLFSFSPSSAFLHESCGVPRSVSGLRFPKKAPAEARLFELKGGRRGAPSTVLLWALGRAQQSVFAWLSAQRATFLGSPLPRSPSAKEPPASKLRISVSLKGPELGMCIKLQACGAFCGEGRVQGTRADLQCTATEMGKKERPSQTSSIAPHSGVARMPTKNS